MTNERLIKALQLALDNDCIVYREHNSSGNTRVQIFNPFWECIFEGCYPTGATDKQCKSIEWVISEWNHSTSY